MRNFLVVTFNIFLADTWHFRLGRDREVSQRFLRLTLTDCHPLVEIYWQSSNTNGLVRTMI